MDIYLAKKVPCESFVLSAGYLLFSVYLIYSHKTTMSFSRITVFPSGIMGLDSRITMAINLFLGSFSSLMDLLHQESDLVI